MGFDGTRISRITNGFDGTRISRITNGGLDGRGFLPGEQLLVIRVIRVPSKPVLIRVIRVP